MFSMFMLFPAISNLSEKTLRNTENITNIPGFELNGVKK